jgi:DNA-binding response OmpR family regulator
VRLPLALDAVRSPDVATRGKRREGPALRILVVDDNEDGADTLGWMLEALGHAIRVAYDGEAAIGAAAEFRPDVVLLDLGLPKLNGFETCRRLRAQTEGERLTIIAQTGWGQLEDRRRSHEAGFDHHLVKPIDPGVLQKLLESVRPGENSVRSACVPAGEGHRD